jgi:hypothetical protein
MTCLLKHVIEGKIEGKGRRRRRKQLPDDLRETRRYWNFKGEALDRTLWRSFVKRLWNFRKTDYEMMMVLIGHQNTINTINKITNRLK